MRKVFNNIHAAFLTAWKQRRHIFTVYVLQFLMAVPLGAQVYQVLEASIGSSIELEHFLHGYDHTVFSDFLHVHGASLTPLFGQLRWLLLVYLLFSVFLNGGLLSGVVNGDRSWLSFWQGAAAHFFPFLKIAFVFFLPALLVGGAAFGVFLSKWQNWIEYFGTEVYVIWLLYLLIGLYLFLLAFLFLSSFHSRLNFIQQKPKKVRLALKNGLKKARNRFWGDFGLLMLFGLILFLVSGAYWLLEQKWGMTTAVLIVVFFALQQLLILFRIAWRTAVFSSLSQ